MRLNYFVQLTESADVDVRLPAAARYSSPAVHSLQSVRLLRYMTCSVGSGMLEDKTLSLERVCVCACVRACRLACSRAGGRRAGRRAGGPAGERASVHAYVRARECVWRAICVKIGQRDEAMRSCDETMR